MIRPILIGLALVCAGLPAFADLVRPKARPVVEDVVARAVSAELSFLDSAAPHASLRPALRPRGLSAVATVHGDDPGFHQWIKDFRPRATRAGINARTFDAAFRGVRFDPKVVARDSNQSEFSKTIWDYLDSAASDNRVLKGREMLRTHGALLNQIEAHYGVDKEVVLAIWGMESNFGSHRGSDPVIQSMASLAYDGRRRSFFEGELIAALKILQGGHTSPENLRGSWAGAMGHTQFMPSSFNALAVDFTGDGRRDIWSENPADALASTANYLKKSGWIRGMPWGVEVQLPRGFDYTQVSRKIQKMPSQWARLGVLDMDGRPVRDYGAASLLLPAGHRGVAFMVFKNFRAIERYNAADAYVIGVGHLSDRIMGGPKIRGSWPVNDRALTFSERKEMQRRLTAAGFNTRGVDGRLGPNSLAALRAYQRARGLVPDGYASLSVLQKLR
ncbi:lytic murein transglycosylase [Tropicibacter naphthalenivorans]|uniref:Membrane-bound lytic murein transglycosylase B n=1 Tax=Tropicibacter naphthalenivorans TaxID=441103 RepID=A0A0P1FZE8_9RHOB|nr:lytic murein transglycosylase [Tropicibacter naphthalenivorans]CUH74725.1 Membrane-bound lytic murein transglycosylase B precursor [Tropicibacter naphthalenivorans]SMC49532.1 lytic murein transglycosylase [Tropicibacter naphthalenivorans]